MKIIPTIVTEERKQETQSDFFSTQAIPVGMNYIEPKNEDDKFGEMSLLFLFENKLDSEDIIYVETLFKLEHELEIEAVQWNPFNIKNWPEDFKTQYYDPIMKNYDPGKNVYGSDFTFTKTGANGEELSETAKSLLEGVTTLTPDPYYTFEAVYLSDDSKLDTIRRVNLDKGSWLQISQFLYWIMMSMPVAPNLFTIDSYKRAKFIKVNDMTYDGCTQVLFGQPLQDTIMAHFTLFFDNTINVGSSFGFNVPCEVVENGIIGKYVDEQEYVNAYAHDDTVLPDRVFMIFSPERMCCLLTGLQKNDIIVFTLDPQTAAKLDWMNWSKYIYANYKEEEPQS